MALAAFSLAGFGGVAVDEAASSAGQAGAPHGNGGTPAGAREVVGCTGGPAVISSGRRSRPVVALTFDDGPSSRNTPLILSVLDRLHARATFFEEGRRVAGHEAVMRHILASGDEIGNHSFHHPLDPGYRELAITSRLIHTATGFRPCLFRPPYGVLDGKVEAAARRAHLTTVLWDVDSRDDKHPGAAAIRSEVLGLTRPGSIVLMHDGGRHPQTVAALPGVIRGLRARGFRLATVTALLGGRFLYRG